MEEDIPERRLLLDALRATNDNSNCNTPTNDSSITLVLVFSSFVVLCGSFCYGSAVGYSSAAEFGIMKDLGLSIAAYSVFGSIITIGGMIGAILSGNIADLIGRKRTLWLSQIFCILGWLTITFAKHAWLLDIGRLSLGFASGLITYVVPVYIAEITPKNVRGRFIVVNQLMDSGGLLVMFLIGDFVTWRTLSLLATIPCIGQIVGLIFIPESPRWLAAIGREKELEDALQRLRGLNADVSQEAIDIKDTIQNFQHNHEARFLALFQRKYSYPILIGVGIMLLQQLGGNGGIGTYLSNVFAKANFSSTIGPTAVACLQLPACILGVILMDSFGRRTLLMVSAAGCCFCLCITGSSFYLQELHYMKELTPMLTFFGILAFGYAFAIGMSGIPWVLMSEIFPMSVKASAGSLVTLVNWSCSWIVTYAFNFMLEWNAAGTFFLFAAMFALNFLFIWMLLPETKGRTLEEIQATLITC